MKIYDDMVNESIGISKTDYGTNLPNLDNKNIIKQGSYISGFVDNDINYSVHIGVEGDVTFGVFENDLKQISNTRTKSKNVFTLFGKILYVALEILKRYPKDEISFDGSDSRLSRLYSRMVKNPSLLKEIEKHGYIYDGFEDGLHWFIKV